MGTTIIDRGSATITVDVSFRSALVRALAWSCFDSSLVDTLCTGEGAINAPRLDRTPDRERWLGQLDLDDSPLRQYLANHCRSPRLGLVFESLWHFFLEQDPRTRLLAHNLPLRQQGGTLGEFDVIYQCLDSGQVIHLELAVKFYLHVPSLGSTAPFSGWLGPNQADRLDRKIQRLLDHQLPLSTSQAAARALAERGLHIDQRQLQLSGRLFRGWASPNHSHSPFLKSHPRGDWMPLSPFLTQPDWRQWRYLAKPDWLGGDHASAEPLTQRHLRLAQTKPIMLISPEKIYRFLCPDNWPVSPQAD